MYSERNQITKYAEGFVNKRNESGFDLINKYFTSSYLFNHSVHCRGEKNVFVHEFKKIPKISRLRTEKVAPFFAHISSIRENRAGEMPHK